MSTSSIVDSGHVAAIAAAIPAVRATLHRPGAIGAHTRTDGVALRPGSDDIFAAVQHTHKAVSVVIGEARAPPPSPRSPLLLPNAPPLASGDTGSPPGSHHEASGSR